MTDATHNNKPIRRADQRRKRERQFAVIAILLIIAVWVAGAAFAGVDYLPAVQEALPEADHFVQESPDAYAAWADAEETSLLGYVAIGRADGYGGTVEMAVAVDLDGAIIGNHVVTHKESPTWFDRVMDSDFMEDLYGKPYSDAFTLGDDLDGVTGATYTTRALAQAALDGSQTVARILGKDVPVPPPPDIQFGIPEVTLLGLFAVGYVGHRRNFKYKKQVRWGSMLVGLIVLGFVYNLPLTLAYFVKLILGYWPAWQTNLYWYFLIGGILFVVTADNKNPYCEWFCPFGAAQECMGLIGGAKIYPMRQYRNWLKWAQRGLALVAILLGVFFRSPGIASYEVFGALFSFVGSNVLFAVLAMVLLASLFVKRPWCNFLCPIDPAVDFIRVMRQWVKELWQKTTNRTKTA